MDILSVHTGQEAEITVDALPGRAFTGTVTAIDPNGKNNGGNSKYTVTITMPRAENMLDGMNATAVLTVGTTENVLWLPAEALAEQGFKTVVYTGFDAKTGELTGPVEVVTGVSDGDKVEIVSGLEEGQTVWYIAMIARRPRSFRRRRTGECLDSHRLLLRSKAPPPANLFDLSP